MSSTGTTTCEVELLADASVDELDLAPGAGHEPADLLERTLRRREADALERHLDEPLEALQGERQVRPALRPATAWTSSRITVSTPRSVSRACEVSRRKSDSGVVMRMSGGVRSIRRRSSAGVSPVRTATWSFEPSPASGLRRLRSMS